MRISRCEGSQSAVGDGLTLDSLGQGRLKIFQSKHGYRFSLDAVLLAGLTELRPRDFVVDLGTGCGVIPLLLASRGAVAHVTGIEIQDSLVSLARRNVEINGLKSSVHIIHGDLKGIAREDLPRPATVVVSNPPYRELRSGRLNPIIEKAAARHELLVDLTEVVRAAGRLLPQRGRLALIYPVRRLGHLLGELTAGGFSAKKLTMIHATIAAPARLVHVEAVKGGGEELQVRKPFCIYTMQGDYTA
ncbi:MAG: methyltransferase, partial [Deltaproteobacteria bacterium]|nr:methyltransferase [Deltaproteobacteria bacterium]